MKLERIAIGDLVRVDKRGRIFHAEVRGLEGSEVLITPLERRETYRRASAREVVAHWRRAGREPTPPATAGRAAQLRWSEVVGGGAEV
jgi:hypothetical protein